MGMEKKEEEDRALDRAVAVVLSRAVSLDSPTLQGSPFLNYLNNLSPIKSAMAENRAQAFSGINSSPLLFASPTENLQPRVDHMEMNEMLELTNEEHSHNVRKDDLPDSSEFVNEEFSDLKDVLRVQPCSSSCIADAFLADPFEADCANSTRLHGQHGHCSRSTSEYHCGGYSYEGFGREDTHVGLVFPEKRRAYAKKLFECDGPTVESEEYHDTEPSFSVRCDVAMGDLSLDNSENQVDIGPVSDNNEGCHTLYDPVQDSVANENHGQDASESLRLLAVTHHPEVMQQQRFVLRRCLRFDDTLLDVSSSSPRPLSYNVTSPGSLTMGEQEKVIPSEVTSTYIKTFVKARDGKSSAMTTDKPSGIGLHLNSIIGARSVNSRETIRMKHDKDNQGGRDLKPVSSGIGNKSDKPTSFPFSVEPQNFSEVQELYDTPLDKRTLALGFSNAEFTQTNAKRRRKASNTSDGDGCKRCSCKKSRCLKLYCDCFAAGLFCTEPCACHGCLNRFEEQDAVLAARKLIISRNPRAFTPKLVHTIEELDASNREDVTLSTPSSSRHKKGCNCKRSMCQKKYCECYQANVGCSDNCRCEGCRNVFGIKEDFLVARELPRSVVEETSFEGMSIVKPATVATYSRDHLMPPTPSFQFSDNRKGLQRPRRVIECLSSSSSVKSGAAGLNWEMQSEGNEESSTLMPITDLTNPDFSEMVEELSPKHESLGSSFYLPPLRGSGRPPSCFLWQNGSLETLGIVSGGENYRLTDKPGCKVYEFLDDEAPGVSKDVQHTKSVLVGPPSWKRVSSPHRQVPERRSTSTALRSGGKFILKAVPSVPP